MPLKFLSCCWPRFEYFWLTFAFQQTSCDREKTAINSILFIYCDLFYLTKKAVIQVVSLRKVDFRTCSQRLVSCAGIAEVKGSNPVQAWILPGFFFRNCKSYFKSLLSLRNRVLRVSNGLDEPGPVNWDLALCLLLAWIICYLCVCKGVKSSGKVSKQQSQGCKLAARWME